MATHDEEKTRPTTSSEAWGLAYPGLVMSTDGKNEVQEFTGMWPLKPDADLVAFTKALAPGGWPDPPGESFSEMMTKLGLIRTARWFVARTPYFPGTSTTGTRCSSSPSSTAPSRSTSTTSFSTGRTTWRRSGAQCVGCPTGPDATARDIVEYIARGQIKTLACYDVAPGLSIAQIYKAADWYEKTQKFQRAVSAGDGNLEDKVNAFLQELAEPYEPVLSGAAIDTDVAQRVAVRRCPRTHPA